MKGNRGFNFLIGSLIFVVLAYFIPAPPAGILCILIAALLILIAIIVGRFWLRIVGLALISGYAFLGIGFFENFQADPYFVRPRLKTAIDYGFRVAQSVSATPTDGTKPGEIPQSIKSIQSDAKGVVTIELAFAPLQGKKVLISPLTSNESGKAEIKFACLADTDIAEKYLPDNCRKAR
ncbi:MAG: hypothetical protein H6R18_2102 [Proteobacteria bacterium]|nr:hypothetical protein [Pseudomonadota bacterium]